MGGQVISSEITLPLGTSFEIDIAIDHPHSTSLSIQPPLPSSLLLSPSRMLGNLTTSLNQTFILTARNPAGSVNYTLHIDTEQCEMELYVVRYQAGEGRGKVTVNNKVIFEKRVNASTVIPFCVGNATVVMELICTSPQGCWYSLYHGLAYLPPLFVRYNDHHYYTIELPLTTMTTLTLFDAITVVEDQSFSLFWGQEGFIQSVELIEAPMGLYYDHLEHAIYGAITEMGEYDVMIAVKGEIRTDMIEVLVTVLPEIESNHTLSATIEMLNDNHAKTISFFSSETNRTIVTPINGEIVSTHRILQPVFVYDGIVNITDLL